MLLGYRDADRGHIIENIVFLELIRVGITVYISVKLEKRKWTSLRKNQMISYIFR